MKNIRKILIIGSDGEIGSYIFSKFKDSSFQIYGTSKRNKDESIIKFDLLDRHLPFDLAEFDACIISASINSIEYCDKNPHFAHQVNVISTIKLIKECIKKNIFLIYFSSVSVFNGKRSFFKTEDTPSPFTNYGKYKLEVENFIQKEYFDMSAILRFTKVISEDTPIIKKWLLNHKLRRQIIAYKDKYISPISLKQIYMSLNIILERKLSGIYHIGNHKELSFYEFALEYFQDKNLSTNLIEPIEFNNKTSIYDGKYSSLCSSFYQINNIYKLK